VVLVQGHYLRKDGVTRICDALIGSKDPECGGTSLVVTPGAGSPHTSVHHAHGSVWTSRTVAILGRVSGKTLHRVGCA
jgi:streptogramin lyase